MKKYFRKEGGEMFRKKVMMFLTGSLLMLVSSVPAWGSAVPPESSVQAEADISGDADERLEEMGEASLYEEEAYESPAPLVDAVSDGMNESLVQEMQEDINDGPAFDAVEDGAVTVAANISMEESKETIGADEIEAAPEVQGVDDIVTEMPASSEDMICVSENLAKEKEKEAVPCIEQATVLEETTEEPPLLGSETGAVPYTVSVEEYGAKGTDKKDDAVAIQKAVNSVQSSGGTVYIPKGTYYISKALVIPSFVTLTGEGSGSVILKANKAVDSLVKTDQYAALTKNGTAQWNDTAGVPMGYTLSGITFDGAGLAKNGISMYGYGFQLRDLYVRNYTGTGVLENWGSNGNDVWNDNYSKYLESYVAGLHVSGCKTGIEWNGLTDAYLTDLLVHDCTTGMIVNAPIYLGSAEFRKNDLGLVLAADAQVEDLVISKCGTGVRVTGWNADIDNLRASGNTQSDLDITSKSKGAVIRNAVITTDGKHTAVSNKGGAVIGKLTIDGKTSYNAAVKDKASLSDTDYFRTKAAGLRLAEAGNGNTVVDAASFGAKGNQTADDTKALQAAIDSLRATGGTVHLGPGTYRITKKLLIYSGITLEGDGVHVTRIFLGDNSNCAMLESVSGAKGFVIKDIEFVGNKWNGHNTGSAGLVLNGSAFVIDNVWINGASGDGVYVNTQKSDVYALIRNLNIRYCGGKGIVYRLNGSVYTDCLTVSESGGIGLDAYTDALFGFVHLYANHGAYQMVDTGGLQAEKIVSESSYGIAVLLKANATRIGTLQAYNNRGTDLYAASGAKNIRVGTMLIKNAADSRASFADLSTTFKYGLLYRTQDAGYDRGTMKVSGPALTYEYAGSAILPSVKAVINGKTLKKGTDYTVSYVSNKAVGTGAVIVTGLREGLGSFVIPFKIVEKDYSGTYYIASAVNTNLVIDVVNGSKAACANVWLYAANKSGAQKFVFKKQSDGYYTIKNAQSGMSLDIYNGSSASGTNVWQYATNGSAAQLWKIIQNTDGSITIRSKLGTVLDIYNGSITSGTNIWAYASNGSAAQKWKLLKV